MGYFSLPESTSAEHLVESAVRNLSLWSKLKDAPTRRSYSYLLGLAQFDVKQALENEDRRERTYSHAISNLVEMQRKSASLKTKLVDFVQDKDSPLSDRFKVWLDMYEAGIYCHSSWLIGDSSLYCNNYSRHETLDVLELVSGIYRNDPRSIDLLFEAVRACVHTFEFDW